MQGFRESYSISNQRSRWWAVTVVVNDELDKVVAGLPGPPSRWTSGPSGHHLEALDSYLKRVEGLPGWKNDKGTREIMNWWMSLRDGRTAII